MYSTFLLRGYVQYLLMEGLLGAANFQIFKEQSALTLTIRVEVQITLYTVSLCPSSLCSTSLLIV